jgi:hypothetical protein
MFRAGKMTPSLSFDVGFVKGYLGKTIIPSNQADPEKLKSKTNECLDHHLSNSACVSTGFLQGALAYAKSIN